jgi:hypothetical protein
VRPQEIFRIPNHRANERTYLKRRGANAGHEGRNCKHVRVVRHRLSWPIKVEFMMTIGQWGSSELSGWSDDIVAEYV